MNKHHLIIIALLALAGCSSSNYQAANKPGDYGYSETQLRDNIYRLHYQCKRNVEGSQASDYAILRAAELCLQHNKSYFVILDRDDEVRNRSSHIPGRRETEINFREYDETTGTGHGEATTRVFGGSSSRYAEPKSLLLVQFVDEKKPVNGKPAYDAQYVKNAIETKYGLAPKG